MTSRIVLVAGLLVFGFSCHTAKNQNPVESSEGAEEIILGSVEHIENGKDGYTAKINTPRGVFFATISIPNLGSAAAYKDLETGTHVALKGESWKLGEENRLTVQKIVSTNNERFEVSGKVLALSYGIDGYTAEIAGNDGEKYFATMSIPNLGANHEKYREYTIGDDLTVIGELWQMSNTLHITVRDIKE